MTPEAVSALTQLGLSGIFAIACVQLFLRGEDKNREFTKYLIETINVMRQQNTVLMDQNRMLSIALFGNNPDAQRAFAAMQRQNYNPSPYTAPVTDLGEK